MLFTILFTAVTLITTGLGFGVAVLSQQKKTETGKYLCYACLGAGVVNISYLFSVFLESYFLMSFFTSVYFAAIDIMLYCLLCFVHVFTRQPDLPMARRVKKVITIYTVFDVLVLMINPFQEIAVSYERQSVGIASYIFHMKPLYQMHLIFTYLLVALILFRLLQKVVHTPSVYRNQYMMSVYGIIAVVFYNAVFLFSSGSSAFSTLDYSIWGYSFCSMFLYWNCFKYSTHGMMNYFRNWILESVDQGIVLFDYENMILAKNETAASFFPESTLADNVTLETFLAKCHINPESIASDEKHSFQCFKGNGGILSPLRCDYRALKSQSNEVLGRLFVFTDNSSYEVDLLTGFHSWDSFQSLMESSRSSEKSDQAVSITAAVCDINGLQSINDTLGRNSGDRAIAILAGIMRQVFPSETYFIRGNEATLIGLCFSSQYTEEVIQERLKNVQRLLNETTELGCFLDIQSAVSSATPEQPDIFTAIHTAERGMKAKKMMDKNSSHSELMTSLICALQETDNDTEAHVQRTQIMGAKLAKRMGLSDLQQSNLSLLCILHDIGKIGIPLEILNKPGKLTDAEWVVLKTHVEKGYQIIKSSQELSGIADMVRHHHERWDGHGYPDGLSKESIPLLSRIISVVDAYDAMVNDRSYRPATTSEKAIAELKRCAGSQFDPNIVSEFIALLESDPSILELTNHKGVISEIDADDGNNFAPEPAFVPALNRTIHPVQFSRYILNADSDIISADDYFETLTGYSKEDYTQRTLNQGDLIFPSERMDYFRQVSEQLAKRSIAFFEHRLRRKNGTALYVFCYGRLYYDSATRSSRSEIIVTDTANTYSMRAIMNEEYSKSQIRLEQWEKKFRCDSLTGLLTQEAFRSDASEKLLASEKKAIMLMMDLDYFKEYNDTKGHPAGDEFLVRVAQALQNTLRKDDYACRMGGDKFAAILFYSPEISDQIMIERSQQICDKLNLILSSKNDGTSLSMGAAISSPKRNTFQTLYTAADQALCQSKEKGRACLSIYMEDDAE